MAAKNQQYRDTHGEEIRLYRSAHTEEQRDYMRQYVKEHPVEFDPRRQQWFFKNLRILKEAQGCSRCGKRSGTLAHHHLDKRTKLYGVTQMANCSLEMFIDEIAKCTVLCVHCHASLHGKERGQDNFKKRDPVTGEIL
jgi:hypothetical protein